MSGSKIQSKTGLPNELQLPLKGFIVDLPKRDGKRDLQVEGMGEGRYRVIARKKRPDAK